MSSKIQHFLWQEERPNRLDYPPQADNPMVNKELIFLAEDFGEGKYKKTKNHQPAYNHKYPAVRTHFVHLSAFFSARRERLKMQVFQKRLPILFSLPIHTACFPAKHSSSKSHCANPARTTYPG
jgi:hypothetical protein